MQEDIEQEIRELEQEARYELHSPDTRRFYAIKAHLLRNGYRMQQSKKDVRLIDIVHIQSGKAVYETTQNGLRMARADKSHWLQLVRQEFYKIAEGIKE